MPFWKWSHTASSNATADSTINWAEGMAPSAVNDSARAMMARLAEWRDDVSGTIITAGTSTAYTIASNQGFDNLADMNGAMIAFVPHTGNDATVTLNVDGLGAKPLRFGPALELPPGTLIQGTPYAVTYNNSDGAFYLRGFMNPYGTPLGGMMPYIGSSAPSSAFALPYGQAISRTTYATLFSLVGTTYGSGDGSTTFNIPDLRGRVAAALDNMGGSAASRIGTAVVTDGGTVNGQTLGSAGGSGTHVQTSSELATHNHGITDSGHVHTLSGGYISGTVANSVGFNAGANSSVIGASSNSSANSAATGIAINAAGGAAAMSLLPPVIMLNYILRII